MLKFAFPFGLADLHAVKTKSPIEQPTNASALYNTDDGGNAVYTDNTADTFYLRDGSQWFGLAAFTFCAKNRTHFRDYIIQDIRLSGCPVGVYMDTFQHSVEQLHSASGRGKSKVIAAKFRALFEDELIEAVVKPLLPRSDSMEIMGVWQLQEKLFELGFKPAANCYRKGDLRGG